MCPQCPAKSIADAVAVLALMTHTHGHLILSHWFGITRTFLKALLVRVSGCMAYMLNAIPLAQI